MSSLNKKQTTSTRDKAQTHSSLLRLVAANMLWEDQFYVDGESSAKRIQELVQDSEPSFVQNLALYARTTLKLRHVPLFLLRELARINKLQAQALTDTIERADEITEFLAIYWKDGKEPLSNQVKRGLAEAFHKFSEYQFAKYDSKNNTIRLRDVMFMVRPKPRTNTEAQLFTRLANQQLATPDTWEVALSTGQSKAETFVRLMQENKLGALAFIRNLKNMINSGVDEGLIRQYSTKIDLARVLPFRFIAAARQVPQLEDMLEGMMLASLNHHKKLKGKTVLLVDVSGSMFGTPVSEKSDLSRFDAAAALTVLCREVCEEVEIYSFSDGAVRVPARRGFSLVEALFSSQHHGGTNLGRSLGQVSKTADRYIVFTDEQSHDWVPNPPSNSTGYIINVASYEKGIENSNWITLSGFSEAVLDYIQAIETIDPFSI